MAKLTRKNLIVLIRRRDYLLERISNSTGDSNHFKNEITALNRVITLAKEHVGTEIEDDINFTNNDFDLSNSPTLEEIKSTFRKEFQRREETIIKEISRSETAKLIITYEYKGERDWISFQSYHINDKTGFWKRGSKTRVYMNELDQVLDSLIRIQKDFE